MKGEQLLKGLAASPGKAKGRVKIILDFESISKIKKGEILVAPYTTPLLTVAIFKASAIVTETGGISSHAAIIARELGIPCVVGAQNATRILKDGMEVVIDGERGEVCIA